MEIVFDTLSKIDYVLKQQELYGKISYVYCEDDRDGNSEYDIMLQEARDLYPQHLTIGSDWFSVHNITFYNRSTNSE